MSNRGRKCPCALGGLALDPQLLAGAGPEGGLRGYGSGWSQSADSPSAYAQLRVGTSRAGRRVFEERGEETSGVGRGKACLSGEEGGFHGVAVGKSLHHDGTRVRVLHANGLRMYGYQPVWFSKWRPCRCQLEGLRRGMQPRSPVRWRRRGPYRPT